MIKNISIIIPAHNEAGHIRETLDAIAGWLPAVIRDFEILVVDDGSDDETRSIVADYVQRNGRVRLIVSASNEGKGAALRKGISLARNEWLLLVDADNQVEIGELGKMLPCTAACDAVIGRRSIRKEGLHRRILSRVFNSTANRLLGLDVSDINCPFKLIRREVVREMDLVSAGYLIDAELLFEMRKKNVAYAEMEVSSSSRKYGRSKVTVRRLLQTLWELRKIRRG